MLYKRIYLLSSILFLSCFSTLAEYTDWVRLGKNAVANQNIEYAVYCYTQAIENNPRNINAYLQRSRAYQLQGQFLKSADDKKKAFDLNPEYAQEFLKSKHTRVLAEKDFPLK